MDYKKKSSKLHRKHKREEVQENGTPGVKVFHLKHRDEALGAAIQVDVDINALPSYGRGQTVSQIFSSFRIADLEIVGAW
jgi:hypothetical protein